MRNRYKVKRFNGQQLLSILISVFIFSMNNAKGQTRPLNYGLLKPQDASMLPKSLAPMQQGVLKIKTVPHTILQKITANEYLIKNGWEMIAAAKTQGMSADISKAGFNSSSWYNATVPGTVLTTLVNQGVYPNPYWGINNLSIPDTLCRQNWWYRTQFNISTAQNGKTCWLTFNGINYEAHIWLNGHNLGSIKGAFNRGIFNATPFIKTGGANVLAVEIVPPPHPGIPHEQSILAQRGPNGGALCLDGPTFISSEGWDWIPGIRDRNIGIWQDVAIRFANDVTIVDPQVITDLNIPDNTEAKITIKTNVHNSGQQAQQFNVTAAMEGVKVSQQVKLAAGETRLVTFSADQFPFLKLINPRLWWPNGYGKPELYHLELTAGSAGNISDSKKVRFGVRELSYELTVDAPGKKNWRVEYDPTDVAKKTDKPLFDNTSRRMVAGETVVPGLLPGVDASLLKNAMDNAAAPYLIIKVNGKRIFCRGGNWGMDDGMKRSTRQRLEPYFKLSREANFNMVRNWTGESTEEVFYDLCDEYGLLVWNDFWTSTEFSNVMPLDNALFLANVKDVLIRYRNHPSIAIWCPRNEGYATPELEMPLANMIAGLDGTRHYQGNSRYMNLRTSGPWYYQKQPEIYYTHLADGFSTELGTPSVPTIGTMRKMMAKEDLWPISDVWHYHDFHFGQKDYVTAIDSLYGTPNSAEDFCRKAQLVNYDSHRAMFESWNSRMWNNASGMLIWMSQPAWPSVVWQAYSSDYETFGSYYGLKSACEPIHIQMNLPDNKVVSINTTLKGVSAATAKLTLFDPSGKILYQKQISTDVPANRLTECFVPQLPANLTVVYLARLELKDGKGKLLSKNDYWKNTHGDFKIFNNWKAKKLTCDVMTKSTGNLKLKVTNTGNVPCLSVKINLSNAQKQLILPAYCSDGYFNLLPGESKEITCNYKDRSNTILVLASAYNLPDQVIKAVKLK